MLTKCSRNLHHQLQVWVPKGPQSHDMLMLCGAESLPPNAREQRLGPSVEYLRVPQKRATARKRTRAMLGNLQHEGLAETGY